MEQLKNIFKSQRTKRIIYITCAVILVGWVVFRFVMIASENKMDVFNAARDAAQNGVPVHTIEMSRMDGTLREPITVQNNRAYVSASRVDKLRAGQTVGNGEIVSVSRNIDLNTGMHIVRTRNVPDGLQYAEYRANGYFVPLYAIHDNSVMIVENGVATSREITIVRQDSQTALVNGLNDGDTVILSKINAGDKVKTVK